MIQQLRASKTLFCLMSSAWYSSSFDG